VLHAVSWVRLAYVSGGAYQWRVTEVFGQERGLDLVVGGHPSQSSSVVLVWYRRRRIERESRKSKDAIVYPRKH